MRVRSTPASDIHASAGDPTWVTKQAVEWVNAGGGHVVVISGSGLQHAVRVADSIDRRTAATASVEPRRSPGIDKETLTGESLLAWTRADVTRFGTALYILERVRQASCDLVIDTILPSWWEIGESW